MDERLLKVVDEDILYCLLALSVLFFIYEQLAVLVSWWAVLTSDHTLLDDLASGIYYFLLDHLEVAEAKYLLLKTGDELLQDELVIHAD